MAKIRLGVMVGAASGSLGSTVFSHNRYGTYVRLRSVPTKATSLYAEGAKAVLGLASQIWGNLDDDQRQAWVTWAQTNQITNTLGDKQTLDGHAACTRLNAIIYHAGGTPIEIPPIIAAPAGLVTLTGTVDIGAGDVEIVYTPTPLGTNNCLQLWAAVVSSPGVKYVQNLYKNLTIGPANGASPLDFEAELVARFGTLQVGQIVHLRANVIDKVTGLVSAPLTTQIAVTST